MITIQQFLDIRRHGFLRAAAVSPDGLPARPQHNAERHLEWIADAYHQGAGLIVFPELSLRGYFLQDIHLDDTAYEASSNAMQWLLDQTSDVNALIAVGDVVRVGDGNFNGLYVCLRGKVLGIIIKTYPPNYGEFTEGRWFTSAEDLPADHIYKFGYRIPVGNDLLFCSLVDRELILGGDICEDQWVRLPPRSILAMHGARILFGGHGSNYQLHKTEWKRILSQLSGLDIAAHVDASAAPDAESTMSLVFSGFNTISERGTILAESRPLKTGGQLTITDVDYKSIGADRRRTNSWQANAKLIRKSTTVRRIEFDVPLGIDDESVYQQFLRTFDPLPLVPKTDEERHSAFMARVIGVYRRLAYLPKGLRKITIGLSGGIDSTVALMVALAVIENFGKELGITYADIIGVTEPGFGTDDKTYNYAKALGEASGITFREISIAEITQKLFELIGYPDLRQQIPGPRNLEALFENGQVWIRKVINLAIAAVEGGIDLGTSSASEIVIGWYTIFGDGAAHYGANGGMGKSASPFELKWLARTKYADQPFMAEVLIAIADSKPSPGNMPLSPTGEVVQLSHKENGPDIPRDFFEYWKERFMTRPSVILRMAIAAFGDAGYDYTPQELYKWLRNFLWRYYTQRYKPNMLAIDTVKIGSVSPGTHDVTKIPSDITPTIWLVELADQTPIEYQPAA